MSTELGPYPAYRDSGVEWLGRVPEHWGVRKLKYAVAFTGGGTPSKTNASFWRGRIPWVSPKDMTRNRLNDTADHITEPAVAASAANIVAAGAVLVVVRSGILRRKIPVAINTVPMAVNQDMKAMRPRKGIMSEYLRGLIQGNQSFWLSEWTKQGATVESIEHRLLANSRIPIPPLPEQHAIARFLEAADHRIGRYIRAKERLVELLEERKRALIHEAVTGRIDVRTGQPYPAYKDSGVEWLGKVPEHWKIRRVKHAVRTSSKGIQIGPFGSSLTQLRDEDTGFKLYGQEHTISGDFCRGSRWITQEKFRQLRRYELLPNDVVLTRKGSLGKCRLVPHGLKRGIMDSDTIRVRLDPTIVDQEFMVLLLHRATYLRSQIESVQRGAVLWGLNTSTIANLHTALPPIGEQKRIKARVGAFLDRIRSATDAVDRQIALLKEYRTRLIADVVTGKLDVREAAARLPATDPRAGDRDRADTIDTESNLYPTAHEIAKEASA